MSIFIINLIPFLNHAVEIPCSRHNLIVCEMKCKYSVVSSNQNSEHCIFYSQRRSYGIGVLKNRCLRPCNVKHCTSLHSCQFVRCFHNVCCLLINLLQINKKEMRHIVYRSKKRLLPFARFI